MKIGDTIGPYQIIAPIGEGGMGEVFRARDTRLDRTVAVKVSKAAFGERFAREAKSVAALNHPNICTLFDVGPNYLVMEFIEGTPLKGPLPVEKAVEYASQILDALDAAHRKGFVHHDLKPANVLVTKQGIKLLDFGLAQQTAAVGQNDETRTAVVGSGEIAGTPQYMAPEQLQGKPADARSDLFAFGCVLYELLSGKKAFDGENTASVIAAILEREPAALDLHPPLDRVIRKCLAKDPDDRFQTARDLKYNLSLAMEQQPAKQVQPRANRWRWAVAAAALAVGGLIGWAVTRSRHSPAPEQAVRFQIDPPEGGQFDIERGLAVSPDGRSVVFYATAPGKRGLWVRPLDTAAPRLLAGTESASSPFWSPDNVSIAYFAAGKIWRMESRGGSAIAISTSGNAVGGTWASDGRIVFGTALSGLFWVPASGGTPEPLTTPDASRGETYHRRPYSLPGGRMLFRVVGKPEKAGIFTAALANPAERARLVSSNSGAAFAAGHLLWQRGSTLVAQQFDPERLHLSGEPKPIADPVSAAAASGNVLVYARGDTFHMNWLDHLGRPSNPVNRNFALRDIYSVRISPDGRRLAGYRSSDSGGDLWMMDVERNTWSRFTFLPGASTFPVWSPDSKTVIFRSGFPDNLYRKEASGAGIEQRVTESPNRQWPQDWSSDGRSLLYFELSPDTQRDLWILPVDAGGKPDPGAKPRPYIRTRYNEYLARFSPEPSPRWVAYTSDESGRDEIYVQAFPEPRGKFQVSTAGGTFPEWSPDGREVYFVSPDQKLMAASLKLSADAVEPMAPRALFDLPAGASGMRSYTVAPDGKRFLVAAPAGGSPRIEVIVNWTALLKQGAQPE